MLYAFDTISRDKVSAEEVAKNNIDEPFRYECLCCGEEVHIAAKKSRKKAPYFHHLRGNSDKDCELYLGRLLQTGAGIESAIAVAQKRARSHAEILFDVDRHLFYFAIAFSEEKIVELQEGEYELEIKTESSFSIKPVLINRTNFAPDSPVKFPLKLTSNLCRISLRSRKSPGKIITSYYDILKPIDFPTFFKLQANDGNASIAKRHTDGIIYTDTRYYLLAAKKEYIEKVSKYSPDVSIGRIEEIAAFGIMAFGAEIMISDVVPELQDTMQYFGYYLRKADRVTMLWPPVYYVDGEIHCRPGRIFLSCNFDLKAQSNITCGLDQISNDGDLYTIDFLDSLRISHANTSLQLSSEEIDTPIVNLEPRVEITTVVEVPEGRSFYIVGKDGYRLLSPGRYHLTEGIRIFQYEGNYPVVVYSLPAPQKNTAVKTLMDIRKYYNVMMPFEDELIKGIRLSKVAEIYIEECRKTGSINVKALEKIKVGLI